MAIPYQPLGSGGGGDPHRPTPQDKVERAVAEHQQALHEAGTLFEELRSTPGVATVATELENRINQLLQGDAYAAALLRIIERWRQIIEGAPKAAEDKVRRLLGPVLVGIKDETQAAP